VLVATQGEQMERDYYYATACDAADLPPLSTIAHTAAERTVKRLNPRTLKTQHLPVIYSAEIAREFMGHFLQAIKGKALYQKASFLLDKLDKRIFPTWFNAFERPHLAKALGSTPFDPEGLATYDKHIIQDGILNNYAIDVYSARKLKMKPTGNASGVYNFVVEPSQDSLQTLLKTMNTGILLTEVMGPGVNIVTGDYSRGAAGFYIENGEIQFPVSEFTIAGNLKDIFQRIAAVGNDVDVRGNVRTPSILIEDMMIGGK
jgi:PmbA protein